MKKHILLSLIVTCFSAQVVWAQNVGMNATGATPNTSSILDLNTGNTFTSPNGKGLLIPNVALTSTGDNTTVTSPATSLLVYNTATASSGSTAVSPGFYYWDGSKWVTFTGANGKDWALLGNAGTTVGTNFLGTTDNTDLMFKVNSVKGGLIDIANNQTHFGYAAGLNNTAAGTLTSFFGVGAGQGNTSGTGNTGVGYDALVSNLTGTDNTAVGVQSLYSNTATGNVAMGTNAGFSITSGTYNTALGYYSMNNGATATTGDYNSATGYKSLSKLTSGSFNTGMGYSALLNNTTGSANTGFGLDALYFFSTASYNTASGGYALEGSGAPASNTGVANTALGFCAGSGYSAYPVGGGTNNNLPVTTGSYNTFLGYSTVLSTGTYSNSTAVGAFAQAGASDVLILGGIAGTNNAPNDTKVGIGTTSPGNIFHVVGDVAASLAYSNQANASGRGLRGDNTAASGAGSGTGVLGTTIQSGAFGTAGYNNNTTGTGVGGYGNNYGSNYFLGNGSGASFTGQYVGVYGRVAGNQAASGGAYTTPYAAVWGRTDAAHITASSADRYQFGVYGEKFQDLSGTYKSDWRSGGVLGVNYRSDNTTILSWGSLGYKNSAGTDFGAYGGTGGSGSGTGRYAGNSLPSVYLQGIGGGFIGDLSGSISVGELMGSTSAGSLYAQYNIGNQYTSGYSADIVNSSSNKRVAAYSMTSADVKVYGDGYAQLSSGKTHVSFPEDFAQLISESSKPVITVTPNGNCSGVYISAVTSKGFDVVELNGGQSNVEFSWIAIARRVDANEKPALPADLSSPDFDANMKSVMYGEGTKDGSATPIWYDGMKLRFDKQSESYEKNSTSGFQQPAAQEKMIRFVDDAKKK